MEYTHTIAAAEGILAESLGNVADLHLLEVVYDYPGAPSTLLRCGVTGSVPQIPRSVIIKRANAEKTPLRREAAGLMFINAQERLRGLVPWCYGIDRAAAILVMEDLQVGNDHLLGNILFGHDDTLAEEALIAFNRALGTMHSYVIGRHNAYQNICAQYKVSQPSRHRIHHLLADLTNLGSIFESMGISVSRNVEREIKLAIDAIRDPGPFLTFTHGDATPANAFYIRSGVRLFDLETSDFRHALLDGAFARIRYIYSVWARRIPFAVQRRMAVAYREALTQGCAEAADDTSFNRALATCCAGWLGSVPYCHRSGVRTGSGGVRPTDSESWPVWITLRLSVKKWGSIQHSQKPRVLSNNICDRYGLRPITRCACIRHLMDESMILTTSGASPPKSL